MDLYIESARDNIAAIEVADGAVVALAPSHLVVIFSTEVHTEAAQMFMSSCDIQGIAAQAVIPGTGSAAGKLFKVIAEDGDIGLEEV